MLRWRSGHTLRDRIRNEDIRKDFVVAVIEHKMKESCVRWFEHVR